MTMRGRRRRRGRVTAVAAHSSHPVHSVMGGILAGHAARSRLRIGPAATAAGGRGRMNGRRRRRRRRIGPGRHARVARSRSHGRGHAGHGEVLLGRMSAVLTVRAAGATVSGRARRRLLMLKLMRRTGGDHGQGRMRRRRRRRSGRRMLMDGHASALGSLDRVRGRDHCISALACRCDRIVRTPLNDRARRGGERYPWVPLYRLGLPRLPVVWSRLPQASISKSSTNYISFAACRRRGNGRSDHKVYRAQRVRTSHPMQQ